MPKQKQTETSNWCAECGGWGEWIEIGKRAALVCCANVGDVRNALKEAKTQGKHAVLMRVKMHDATRFVAVPLGTA
jgi:hypothetical protein